MSKEEYLIQLRNSLSGKIPERELSDIMVYYRGYFDDAGAEHEAEVIAELGAPEELARQLLQRRSESFKTYQKRKRIPGWGIALIVVGVLAVLLRVFGWFAYQSFFSISGTVVETVNEIVEENVISSDTDTGGGISETDMEAFQTIDIDVTISDVEIVPSDSYGIELFWNDSRVALSYENKDGTLKIWNEDGTVFSNIEGGTIFIYLPEDAVISYFEISMGMGSVTMGEITAEGGTIETGMGDISLDGTLKGRTKIETGMGDINVVTSMSKGDYSYEISTGLGDITIDDEKQDHSAQQNISSNHSLTISDGMGDIQVWFGE